MALFHVRAGNDGESVLTELELPEEDTPAGRVQGLHGIPVESLGWAVFVDRKPDTGLHPAPIRQFVVVLRGVLEVETPDGVARQLQPGDVLFAEDTTTSGHHSRDVGDEGLGMMVIPVEEGWSFPGS
ncbi:MAG TPA: hypothetical protein VIY72_11100 [Acidimicrobiales bacterium]